MERNRRRILVIDDQKINIDIAKKILGQEYEMVAAMSAEEGLEIIAAGDKIDLILLDVVLPEMSGFEFMEILHERKFSIPVIIMTTEGDRKREEQALKLGAADFIAKPLYPQILMKRVWNIIRVIDAQEENERQIEQLALTAHEAESANQAKTNFLARMSYDIRTPINGVLGMVSLAMDNDNPEDTVECLKKIDTSCQFLLGLVNDTLDMTKVESGVISLKNEAYSFEDFVEYINSVIRPMCDNKGVVLQVQVAEKLKGKILYVDKLRLNQVFFNLLSNAAKFTSEKGTVTLTADYEVIEGGKIHFLGMVEDTGIGMSEEFQKKMFDSYTQEEQVILPEHKGSGLGLAIVKDIVTIMNGHIAVDSKLNQGTKFSFDIECSLMKEEKKALKEDANISSLMDKKVLVAEDHPLNMEIITRLLDKMGMKTIQAENGQKALEFFADSSPGDIDVILMDVRMPIMDGLTATRRIRNLNRPDAMKIPIIAMTANAFQEDVAECMRAGMNVHLAKPIIPSTLKEQLSYCIEQHTKPIIARKILVVDDIAMNAAVLQAILSDSFDVLMAFNGKEALEKLEENQDVIAVITDIQMPQMNGLELIRHIRANREYDHIAILANTQYGEGNQETDLLNSGADDFIYKPTVPELLKNRLAHVLVKYMK